MYNRQRPTTLWIVIALLGCGLALVALAGQVVNAQSAAPELKPPFRFEERPVGPEVQTPGPGSTVLMTETFGATFTATTNLQGSTPLWRVTVNADDTAGYYWGRVEAGTFSNSAWSAARLYTATQALTPGQDTYPAGQDSWLIYGPVDLSRFVYGQLSFEYYLDSRNTPLPGDTLLWGYSTDGQTFYGNRQSGALNKWITDTLSFRANSTFKTVYLAFAFNSHTNPLGKGAFVRNVTLTGEPIKFRYLPIVMNNYAAPTPTPIPPLFGYTFDPGNADLSRWGGAYYNTGGLRYGQCIPGQCNPTYVPYTYAHGNPPNSLRLYTYETYNVVASSPNDIAPDNYDLYVDISPFQIYPRWAGCEPYCPGDDLGDWYGIIFNAKSDATTFGANPSQFHYNTKYYRLYFYNIDSIRPIRISLDRCEGHPDSDKNSCYNLATRSLPGNFIGSADGFDTIHIQRLASGTIQVWLNGNSNPIISVSNQQDYTTGKGFGKYGVFMFSSSYNSTYAPAEMQVDFDNIKVYQR